MINTTVLDALSHMENIMFPNTLHEYLMKVGASKEVADDIVFAYKTMHPESMSVMKLYREYCYAYGDTEWKKYLADVIDTFVNEYLNR